MSKTDPNRSRSHTQRAEPVPPVGGASQLLKRVMRRMAPTQGRAPAPSLPPAGQRSGSGAESVAPYLEEGRSSRPAPLE